MTLSRRLKCGCYACPFCEDTWTSCCMQGDVMGGHFWFNCASAPHREHFDDAHHRDATEQDHRRVAEQHVAKEHPWTASAWRVRSWRVRHAVADELERLAGKVAGAIRQLGD